MNAIDEQDSDDVAPTARRATSAHAALAASVTARLTGLMDRPLAPGLYIVATPIGNLADITLRALAVLAAADIVYCEDTRHSRGLFAAFGIGRALRAYHEHNADAERPRVMSALAAGQSVALISDAGTPLVSDPGYKLVLAARDAGHTVIGIPGPSAVTTALSCAGLPTDHFLFAGFLPPKQAARRAAIAELAATQATLVLFEAPGRVADCLADLASGLGGRPAAIARELTKMHEELMRGGLLELAHEAAAREWRGEVVILVGPPASSSSIAVDDGEIVLRLQAAMAHESLRDAARGVAEMLGVPKKRVYELGLKLKPDLP